MSKVVWHKNDLPPHNVQVLNEYDCVVTYNHFTKKWKKQTEEKLYRRFGDTEIIRSKTMKEEELQKIKEHIEMRARIEPYATEIRHILWKAVEELEATKEQQKQIARMSNCLNCAFWNNKKYDICRRVKKLGKTCCTFWKLKE